MTTFALYSGGRVTASRPPRAGYRKARLGLLAACALGACASPESPNGDRQTFSVSAALAPTNVQPTEAVVLWDVSSGSPDYVFVWGRAPVSGGSFRLELDASPPPMALNRHGLGVGLVATTSASAPLADGILPETFDERSITGLSERHAIIHVDHDAANALLQSAAQNGQSAQELDRARGHWLFDFPPGYSCGVGVPAAAGEPFDSFAPIDCAQFEVRQGDVSTFEVTNWT